MASLAKRNGTNEDSSSSIIEDTYNQTLPNSIEELRVMYDRWATTYEEDHLGIGYKGHRLTAETLAKYLSKKDAQIIDFGSGTGLVGEQLQAQGFYNIHAVDMSPDSLKFCEAKNLYKSYLCATIGSTPLDIKADTYDALVCSGVFMPGHLNQSCFPEMIRIVKPGGLIVVTMREEYLWTVKEYQDNQLENAVQAMVDGGKWEVIVRKVHERYFHDKSGLSYVTRVL